MGRRFSVSIFSLHSLVSCSNLLIRSPVAVLACSSQQRHTFSKWSISKTSSWAGTGWDEDCFEKEKRVVQRCGSGSGVTCEDSAVDCWQGRFEEQGVFRSRTGRTLSPSFGPVRGSSCARSSWRSGILSVFSACFTSAAMTPVFFLFEVSTSANNVLTISVSGRDILALATVGSLLTGPKHF